jgi:hypothetical protein
MVRSVHVLVGVIYIYIYIYINVESGYKLAI